MCFSQIRVFDTEGAETPPSSESRFRRKTLNFARLLEDQSLNGNLRICPEVDPSIITDNESISKSVFFAQRANFRDAEEAETQRVEVARAATVQAKGL